MFLKLIGAMELLKMGAGYLKRVLLFLNVEESISTPSNTQVNYPDNNRDRADNYNHRFIPW